MLQPFLTPARGLPPLPGVTGCSSAIELCGSGSLVRLPLAFPAGAPVSLWAFMESEWRLHSTHVVQDGCIHFEGAPGIYQAGVSGYKTQDAIVLLSYADRAARPKPSQDPRCARSADCGPVFQPVDRETDEPFLYMRKASRTSHRAACFQYAGEWQRLCSASFWKGHLVMQNHLPRPLQWRYTETAVGIPYAYKLLCERQQEGHKIILRYIRKVSVRHIKALSARGSKPPAGAHDIVWLKPGDNFCLAAKTCSGVWTRKEVRGVWKTKRVTWRVPADSTWVTLTAGDAVLWEWQRTHYPQVRMELTPGDKVVRVLSRASQAVAFKLRSKFGGARRLFQTMARSVQQRVRKWALKDMA